MAAYELLEGEQNEPALDYKLHVHLLDEDPQSPENLARRAVIATSERALKLLSERDADGKVPYHPYHRKWYGAHWVLVMLAELDYPPGDMDLVPLRDQVLDFVLSEEHLDLAQQKTIEGRVRMCASIEGNAIFALLKLGLADRRVDRLVENLLAWQWPDGGWNCDKNPQTQVASFTETLIPLRGLALYGNVTGNSEVREAAQRAAGVFLKRHLFKRLSDGSVINLEFLKLHYPCYWHYDILVALKVMAEGGWIGDARCSEALDLLEKKRLPEGGFPAEAKYYRVTDDTGNGRSLVDWGGTSKKSMNPFVTLDAWWVLKMAGRG